MATLGERMKELRELKDISQAELGRFLGYGGQTISQYELDKRKPDLETTQKAADFFNVSMDFLTGSKNYTVRLLSIEELTALEQNTLHRIPVLKTLPADLFRKTVPKDAEYIEYAKGCGTDYKAIIAKDDSMSPQILPGDTVIFKAQSNASTNDIVLISVNKKEPIIRKLVRKNSLVSLIPLNDQHQTLVYDKATFSQKRIWGIVVESRRPLLKPNSGLNAKS